MISIIFKNSLNILTYTGVLTWSADQWLYNDKTDIINCVIITICGLMISHSVITLKEKLKKKNTKNNEHRT